MITSMMAFCVRFVRTTDLIRHGDADIEQQDDLNKVPPLRPLRPCVDNCSTETLLADRFDLLPEEPSVLQTDLVFQDQHVLQLAPQHVPAASHSCRHGNGDRRRFFGCVLSVE